MQNIIEVDNVSFQYESQPIFSQVSFSVAAGEFVAIIGANGAGKSTLLRLLLGELAPTSGGIRLFGRDVSAFKDWAKVGYVAQNAYQVASDFPATALEIVLASLSAQIGLLRFPRKKHREKALRALELVDMAPYARRMMGTLSGGQQQRVMLSRVLVGDPQIMLLDEPTTGVDAQTVRALYQLLWQLNRDTGLTIVMITHDIGRAAPYVTKTLCLEEGSLLELNPVQVQEELEHRHVHPAQQGGCPYGHTAI